MADLFTDSPADLAIIRNALGIRSGRALRAGTHGDSICDLGMVSVNGVFMDVTALGIYGHADAYSGGRINWVWNGGIGGQTSAQISTDARIAATIAQKLDMVVENGGTNDFGGGALASAVFANRKKAWDAFTAAGILVFAMTLPPRGTLTPPQNRELHRLNAMIRRYAAQVPGVVLFDVAKLVTNPDSGAYLTNGQFGAIDTMNNWFQSDNTHLGATGGAYAGYELASLILAIAPRFSWVLAQGGTTDIDYGWDGTAQVPEGNLIKNGKMSGTGGNLNGRAAVGQPLTAGSQMANSWIVGTGASTALPAGAAVNTMAVTKVAKTKPELNGYGFWQQVALPAGNAGAAGVFSCSQDLASNVWNAGDKIAVSCLLEADEAGWCGDGTVYNNAMLYMTAYDASFATVGGGRCFPTNGGNGRFRPRCPDGGPVVLRSPLWTIPANTFVINVSMRLEGVGTYRFSDIQCRRNWSPEVARAA